MRHNPDATAFRLDQIELHKHNVRMAAGCLVCRSAHPLRICPDCYVCIACRASPGPALLLGCDECADLRGDRGTPRIPPTKPEKPR